MYFHIYIYCIVEQQKYTNILKFVNNWSRTHQSLKGKRKANENEYFRSIQKNKALS